MSFNKGFAWLPILLIVVAGLVVGGGLYWYQQSQQAVPSPTINQQESATSSPEVSTTLPASATSSQPTLYVSSITSSQITIQYANMPLHSIIDVTDDAAEGRYPAPWYSSTQLPFLSGTLAIPSQGFISGEGYYATVRDLTGPNGPIARFTFSVTQTDNSAITVPGMSEYTDSNFGFSFWYPSGWTISFEDSNQPNTYLGGDDIKTISVMANPPYLGGFTIAEIYSPAMSIMLRGNAYLTGSTYYFDSTNHVWMKVSGNTTEATTTADLSENTMGGLHIFSEGEGFNNANSVIPLNTMNFLVISPSCGVTPNTACPVLDQNYLAKTITSNNQSVATPVSVVQQEATIEAEQQAYANQ